jgi:hypothetical protein
MTDGTSAVIHTNRLKLAHGKTNEKLPKESKQPSIKQAKQPKKTTDRKSEGEEVENTTTSTLPKPRSGYEEEQTSSNESEAEVLADQDKDSEWEPGPSYKRNQARNKSLADAMRYPLRSRQAGKPLKETEVDKAPEKEAVPLREKEVQKDESPLNNKLTSGHTYNLRDRLKQGNTIKPIE